MSVFQIYTLGSIILFVILIGGVSMLMAAIGCYYWEKWNKQVEEE